MLSPKMQRTVRVNDSQLVMLSERATYDHSLAGYLHKRTSDNTKWQMRWFVLYQNLLFYYESEGCTRPSGVLLLEGCYCERLITSSGSKNKDSEKQYCFAISYRRENQRHYELRTNTESDCKNWIEAIREASFNKLLLQKEELEQKHLHLLQIVESEKTAKWQYTQQCEELASEIKKLRAELCALKKEWRPMAYSSGISTIDISGQLTNNISTSGASSTSFISSTGAVATAQESIELRKIKKVQSFFRGWLCRRRWKQIVEQYIKSPHAESMRKRNSLVFRMVEAEEEYMEQLEVLVSCFLRPFKMAASSKKPPCSHDDVNSIFLNSETVLFLHQIFLKGLTSRMESWPTLVLGDLFDMLLPMLSIYQEYVRNHHYSLQVLTECKQSPSFAAMLKRMENKPACQGRSLETFLTYPMHQIPRYIITLHELLAHTPHDHVERKSLQNARQQLEDLSRQMHDEVSETENLRKNLAVERMIVEGCDILLDVNQVFVRQGSLIQVPADKPRPSRNRLTNFKSEKEVIRQCFLFSNHLILATRTSGGRLHLVPDIGKIPLADATLIEDPNENAGNADDDESSVCSLSSQSSGHSELSTVSSHAHNKDFKIIVDMKIGSQTGQITVHLIAPSIQEKTAWVSDISQCMDNAHFNDLLHSTLSDTSSVTMPQSIKNDPKLFKDDVDIRFSRTLNSCKVPQIRYATPERLLQRLTDLRFLSIDFLNTFLLTYRVFTDGVSVLEALKKVFYNIDTEQTARGSIISLDLNQKNENTLQLYDEKRRISGASSVSGYGSEMSDRDRSHSYDSQGHRSHSYDSQGHRNWKSNFKKCDEESKENPNLTVTKSPPLKTIENIQISASSSADTKSNISITIQESQNSHLNIPKQVITASSSNETLTDATIVSAPCSPSNLSSVTLVGSASSGSPNDGTEKITDKPEEKQDTPEPPPSATISHSEIKFLYETPTSPVAVTTSATGTSERHSQKENRPYKSRSTNSKRRVSDINKDLYDDSSNDGAGHDASHRTSCSSTRSASISYYGGRRSVQEDGTVSTRTSFQHESPQNSSKAGVVITSFRQSQRRSSTSTAATAFAIATSASSNPRDHTPTTSCKISASGQGPRTSVGDASIISGSCRDRNRRKESVMSTAATMRVLNVLRLRKPRRRDTRQKKIVSIKTKSTEETNQQKKISSDLKFERHWVSKHAQDFEMDQRLKNLTIEFLDDIIYSPNLLPAEHKAAAQLLKLITKEEPESSKVNLDKLLAPPVTRSKESIETLSALEIAEQMTYLDHQIFISIASEEFLGQAWMKADKHIKAPHIILMTRRFNEVSQLVVSEIIRRNTLSGRIAAIEKWTAVADISRCLHNFNGMLQICAAFTNTSVYRLKKTWEKVSRTTKQTIEKLQTIVSSDGRFRSLRDALHRCDPPCIPYLGMYLTDLSFIEEGTPNFTEDGLLNFSKMRMIAHVIREIRHFQQTPYKIELITKVTNYLLDTSLLLDDDELYRLSLEIEPRTSRLSSGLVTQLSTTALPPYRT